jgi:hypothetical protein
VGLRQRHPDVVWSVKDPRKPDPGIALQDVDEGGEIVVAVHRARRRGEDALGDRRELE